jgi:hypothetical protein
MDLGQTDFASGPVSLHCNCTQSIEALKKEIEEVSLSLWQLGAFVKASSEQGLGKANLSPKGRRGRGRDAPSTF